MRFRLAVVFWVGLLAFLATDVVRTYPWSWGQEPWPVALGTGSAPAGGHCSSAPGP